MIEVISGTNRPGSNALKISGIIQKHYAAQRVEARVLDLQELPPAIFNPASYATKPAEFAPIQDRILAAKGLHLVVPEYNGSFPGVLKYFIDMLKFPESLERRCVAFTGEAAGVWGALRSVEQLQMIFGYRNSHVYPERVFIPKVNGELLPDGTGFKDEALANRVRSQTEGFADFVRRLKG